MPEKKQKREVIFIRVDPEVKSQIAGLAKEENTTVQGFVLGVLLDHIDDTKTTEVFLP